MKSSDTAQGEECGRIAQALPTTLAMTGTFMGGKASEMFYSVSYTHLTLPTKRIV